MGVHNTGAGIPAPSLSKRRWRDGVCSRTTARPAGGPQGHRGAEGTVPRRCSVTSSPGSVGDTPPSDSQAGCPSSTACPGTPVPSPAGPSPRGRDPAERREDGGSGGGVAVGSPGRERTARAPRLRPRTAGTRRRSGVPPAGTNPRCRSPRGGWSGSKGSTTNGTSNFHMTSLTLPAPGSAAGLPGAPLSRPYPALPGSAKRWRV